MKRKSPRDIPDFSRKRPAQKSTGPAAEPTDAKPARPPAPRPTVKPQATNAKSGRRGS